MKEIYRSPDFTSLSLLSDRLRDAGFETFIRNEDVSSTCYTGMPDFFPAICVLKDGEAVAARKQIDRYLAESKQASGPYWMCVACGERSPHSFEECWSCQAPRTGARC
ncbi:putative signal transducing protein [Roseibacillus ishigakijimensis]|uniref:RanBP2-type domain-containing protein n=1 Tax=Roseibacillus ishigakijimensis TaxID=454146 RepID=A0A934RL69_9BACT|nr:hypothetical protein [Roseibacillus ishigakijimensis]MBK1833752.1 hypothetical protein [Roseibacillus ishigakijimensis]